MSLLHAKPLADCRSPQAALDELCAPLRGYPGSLAAEAVRPEQMPAAYRRLLVHQRHMTLALKEHCGSKLDLYVMDVRCDADSYRRKIFLTPSGSSQAIELGVVRLDLRHLPDSTRQEIIRQQSPLGAVLTRHRILRRIQPRWYLKFPRACPLLHWFGYPGEGPFYGRIGTIWCNDEPAVEVLEIVTLWEEATER
jgi:hypothetical protein